MTNADVRPGKTCRLCNKNLDHFSLGDFTCATCQYSCHRAEPILRAMVSLHARQQKENAQAIKSLKDEISELKSNLATRQSKASTTLKGLKENITELSNEVAYLKTLKTKVEGDDRIAKLEKQVAAVKVEVKTLDQEVAEVYAERQDSNDKVQKAEIKGAVDELEDFTKRLKDAFVALAGPEVKKTTEEEKKREQDAKEVKDAMREMQGFMRQMQAAFSLLPVMSVSVPPPTEGKEATPAANGAVADAGKKA